MKASETEFKKIIEGTTQFVVPHYQRPYSWKMPQWTQLWEDVQMLASERAENGVAQSPGSTNTTHFIGSMVTMPGSSVPQGVTKYVLIDGQQRLTTLMLLLAALRDHVAQSGEERRANMIHDQFLANPYHDGKEHFKLLPTEGENTDCSDRKAFTSIVERGSHVRVQGHAATEAYHFFGKKLSHLSAPLLAAILETITSGLVVVSIVLDRDDNPYTIFESLNAKGQPLAQADLIRNFFFMRIDQAQHDEVYRNIWRPMEQVLAHADTTEFFRQYLMMDGAVVKVDGVYVELKRRLENDRKSTAKAQLERIFAFATCYQKIVDPEKEAKLEIRRALRNLARLNTNTAASFLLAVYHDYVTSQLSAAQLVGLIAAVENFVLRRFMCRRPTNELNKFFPTLYRNAQVNGVFDCDRLLLLLTERRYPSDAEFERAFLEEKLYGTSDRVAKGRYILERLEAALAHKESVPTENLQIEHVLPQSLSETWKSELGEYSEEEFEDVLHRIGNLTLTGYNQELSNSPFKEKQKLLRNSHIELNRYFHELESWTFESIRARSQALAKAACTIWPSLRADLATVVRRDDDVTGKKPLVLRIAGSRFEVTTWSEVLDRTIKYIDQNVPERFETLSVEFANYLSRDRAVLRSPREVGNGFYYEANLSAASIYRLCGQVLAAAECGDSWSVDIRDA